MNLRQLRTMIVLAEIPSFAGAGKALGVSHSAVSLQIKSLEDELGLMLIDRSRRPPALTEQGALLVERARQVMRIVDEIGQIGSDGSLAGALSIGFVPSALSTLGPPALLLLRERYPDLKLSVRAEISGPLAQKVRLGELDLAVTTAPEQALDELESDPIASEPLMVLAPAESTERSDRALLEAYPFIWFDRSAWIGRSIERRLVTLGYSVAGDMEVGSLEAMAALVRHGLGVSIAPVSPIAGPPAGVRTAPFGDPPMYRELALLRRSSGAIERSAQAVLAVLREAAQPQKQMATD
ncbi:MAG: LysR substrate-binding domain-containing protein [Neomegalonema sp.]|nr:LysR substrate-binding domain-containing protein [Neomegalonema sp.]